MCGIAGCGKSSYAKLLENSSTIIVSTDSIRNELYGSESEQGDYKEVLNTAYDRIKEAFKENKNVIFDATNTRVKYRENLLETLKDFNVNKEIYVINTSLEQALMNNNNRDRKVPEYVIKNQFEKFNTPTYSEGWDKIFFINSFSLDSSYVNWDELL